MIVNASRDDVIHSTLDFRQRTVLSMPINESGLLVRLLIAAKFDHTISSGWPVLQIRRTLNGDSSSHLTPLSTMKEPRPTGYLNVFEYVKQAMAFEVQHGDIVRVFWPPDTNPNERRYSLAYFRGSSNVMVSIEVRHQTVTTSQDSSVSTTIPPTKTIDSSYSTTMNTKENTTTTKVSTNSSIKAQPGSVATILGCVLCTIAVLLLLTIMMFVVYRCRNHKKDAKHSFVAIDERQHAHNIELDSNQAHVTNSEAKHAGAIECIEMDANQAYIINSEAKQEQDAHGECIEVDLNEAYISSTVPTEPNVAYGTHPPEVHDYEYVVPSSLL